MFLNDLKDTIASIIRIVLYSKCFFPKKFPRVNNKAIVVLGNGPSLNQTILKHKSILKALDTFAVNFFINSDLFNVFKPKYYLIADPGFWTKTPSKRWQEIRPLFFKSMVNKVQWEMHLFVPYQANFELFKSLSEQNKNIVLVPYNKTTINGFKRFYTFCYKIKLGMPRPQNVLVPSIITAINLGYKNVYIVGADHTWHRDISVNEKNEVLTENIHFYNNKNIKTKRIVLNSRTGKPIRLYQQFEGIYYTFKSYHYISEYAKCVHSNVYNASEISFIDAFERKELNTEDLKRD